MSMQLPKAVINIIASLEEAGFEAYAVGGGVRDLLLSRKPKDWDVATSASPEEIQKVFPKSYYANKFGTVTVRRPFEGYGRQAGDSGIEEIEVTTYRVDVGYSDKRHPDKVEFTKSLLEDLARRDFTVNAMALNPTPSPRQGGGLPLSKGEKNDVVVIDGMKVIDPFGGLKDLDAKLIRAVGNPEERFSEDALRLLRAVRFAAQLDFRIEGAPTPSASSGGSATPPRAGGESTTYGAIVKNAHAIREVSQERIRDELIKLVMSEKPEYGFNLLQQTGLLEIILPELAEGVGVGQNKHHKYTVFEHSIKSLQFAAQYGYALQVRLAALLHDIGKPRTKRRKGDDYTFYGHDIVGARMVSNLMKRLRFPNKLVKQVTHLVRQHMFYYDVGKVTETGARRLLRRIGKENFDDAIKVRIAERKGSGVPKAEPYRLRHLQFMVEKAAAQPISVGQLKIGGNDLIKELKLKPSPEIGGILNALLAEVLDDPKKNTREFLLKRAMQLKDKDAAELKKMGEAAKELEEKKREDDIRRKYQV